MSVHPSRSNEKAASPVPASARPPDSNAIPRVHLGSSAALKCNASRPAATAAHTYAARKAVRRESALWSGSMTIQFRQELFRYFRNRLARTLVQMLPGQACLQILCRNRLDGAIDAVRAPQLDDSLGFRAKHPRTRSRASFIQREQRRAAAPGGSKERSAQLGLESGLQCVDVLHAARLVRSGAAYHSRRGWRKKASSRC